MTPKQLKQVKKILGTRKNVVIVTHWSPDGDAMGSSLGLYNFLKKKHKVTVVVPNDYPSFLFWLPGNKSVVNFSINPDAVKKAVKKADIVFCLDFNSLKRIESLGPEIANSSAVKFLIDHHAQKDDFADYMVYDIKASSTCELVFDFISMLGGRKQIMKDVASCLYAGIMTDTGSFRFPSATAKTHLVVAELLKAGASNSKAYEYIFEDNTHDRMRLIGYALSEKLKVVEAYHTAYITLTREELETYRYKAGDTEGLVNYGLGIRGIRLSVFFVERDGIVKASLRSKGDFDVNLFARKYFSGGGHKNAAGGSSKLSLEETVDRFTGLLPLYSNELQR